MVAISRDSGKPRILFFSEAVTLAHVARPLVLAGYLDPKVYDVHFAHCPRFQGVVGQIPGKEHHIESITPGQFMSTLARGKPLYDLSTLKGYVQEDLRVIDAVQPEIVVGDFRLSLAVSAALAKVPYVTISNAYWSPFVRQCFLVPELPLTRVLGPRVGQWAFSLGRPIGFAMHCLPMHRLRRHYGLDSLGFNLGSVYTHADYTLYADIESLYDMSGVPANHRFIGPVTWSPDLAEPPWWRMLPTDKPLVYVTMGSSGQSQLLPTIIDALGQCDVTAVVSTAGSDLPGRVPDNVFWEKYLPGEAAIRKSSLVICNGGSPTTHQALALGVPVLGLAGNLDQYLNMWTVARSGGGRLLRAGTCRSDDLRRHVDQLLGDDEARAAAQSVAREMAATVARREFNEVLNEICGPA